MKKFLALFVIAIAIYSCGENSSKSKSESAALDQLKELEIVDVNVDSLIANPSMYANQTVRFSGMVDHICKHTGQKLTIVGSLPDSKIKVLGSDVVPNFEPTLNGSKVEIVGFVKGVATENVESCEVDSTAHNITYAIECKTIKAI